MAPLLISIRRFILFLVLIQSVSLYKIYAYDNNRSDLSSNVFSSPLNDEINRPSAMKHIDYNGDDNDDDDDDDMIYDTNNDDENKDNSAPYLSLISQLKQKEKPAWKRSAFSIRFHSSKALPQRRNNRPHWNPLVAAYKRCGELSRPEQRESCFKDAIQMLFVHKLRK